MCVCERERERLNNSVLYVCMYMCDGFSYRLRCYLASLHGTELPNPQTLLASIARPTKVALGKVGVFSVASLHAVVSV